MKGERRFMRSISLLILLIGLRSWLTAGELTIPSASISGGGSSASGAFSVRGTVGESTPAATPLAGGSFTLSEGFASRVAVLLTPGAPRLTLARTVTGFELSWPLPAEGFVLQETPVLATPTGWVNAAVSSVEQNGRHVVSLPAAGPPRFFRLFKAP